MENNEFLPTVQQEQQPVNTLMEVEKSRAVQEVQAALVIAKKFPRDEHAAYTRIMNSCKRKVLAEQAIYRLPIGDRTVEGPSIRLAEVMAQSWHNLDYGIREERGQGKSKCLAFCFDKETNTRAEIQFDIEHWIEVGKKGNKSKKVLTDPNDISRLVANHGSKKLRDCILRIIPGDICEAAQNACRDTLRKGDGKPLADRIRDMVLAFSGIGVNQEMIEERLGHKIDLTTVDEVLEMTSVFNAVKDNQAKRGDFFKFFKEEQEQSDRDEVAAKLRGEKPNENKTEAPKTDEPKGDSLFDQFSKSTVKQPG